jgi:ATP-dependent Zn protease
MDFIMRKNVRRWCWWWRTNLTSVNLKQNFDEKTDVKTTFKDVAGLEGAKEEIQEIVEFLKILKIYQPWR